MFKWTIQVIQYDTYGARIVKRTPMTVLAKNKAEVTEKVRAAHDATYDDFRNFWSHGWVQVSVDEVLPSGDAVISLHQEEDT